MEAPGRQDLWCRMVGFLVDFQGRKPWSGTMTISGLVRCHLLRDACPGSWWVLVGI